MKGQSPSTPFVPLFAQLYPAAETFQGVRNAPGGTASCQGAGEHHGMGKGGKAQSPAGPLVQAVVKNSKLRGHRAFPGETPPKQSNKQKQNKTPKPITKKTPNKPKPKD